VKRRSRCLWSTTRSHFAARSCDRRSSSSNLASSVFRPCNRARRQSMRRPVIGCPHWLWPDTARASPRLPLSAAASGQTRGHLGERGAARNSGGCGVLEREGASKNEDESSLGLLASFFPSFLEFPTFLILSFFSPSLDSPSLFTESRPVGRT